MIEFLKSLPAVALIAGFAIFGHYPPENSLRPWTAVGSSAYISLVNNTRIPLPIFARAPEVDSASRYLGTVGSCDSAKFKLPYVDTKVTLITADGSWTQIDVKDPEVYPIDFNSSDTTYSCPTIRKVVIGLVEFVDPVVWRQSGYARLEDVEVPSMLVLAGDYTLCPVWKISVNPIEKGKFYTCKTQWRIRQPNP